MQQAERPEESGGVEWRSSGVGARWRRSTLLASGLIVGESLVGVALAAAIGLSGKEAPLALVGPDFGVMAQWLGLAAFIVVCLAFRRRVLAAR